MQAMLNLPLLLVTSTGCRSELKFLEALPQITWDRWKWNYKRFGREMADLDLDLGDFTATKWTSAE
jgi:hypothetical protein